MEIVLQDKLTTIFKNEYRETTDKERTRMMVTVSRVSNMLENISSATKEHKKIRNRRIIIISYCLLKFTYFFI